MTREATLGMVEKFYARIWNAGDEGVAHRLLAPELRFRGSTGVGLEGIGPFLDYVRLIRRALADYRCSIEDLVVEDDQAFARMSFAGRHAGTFLGVAPTGRELRWAGAALFRVEGERIRSVWVLGDVDGLKQQLGISEPIPP
jgi:predicted ester cyclase